MAYSYGAGNPYFPNQQTMFLQPSGNIYLIQNSSELTAVPTNMGTVAAICLPENVMYLKTSQNGTPVCYTYKLTEAPKPVSNPAPAENPLEGRIGALEQQIAKILEQLNPTPVAPAAWDT